MFFHADSILKSFGAMFKNKWRVMKMVKLGARKSVQESVKTPAPTLLSPSRAYRAKLTLFNPLFPPQTLPLRGKCG